MLSFTAANLQYSSKQMVTVSEHTECDFIFIEGTVLFSILDSSTGIRKELTYNEL